MKASGRCVRVFLATGSVETSAGSDILVGLFAARLRRLLANRDSMRYPSCLQSFRQFLEVSTVQSCLFSFIQI